MKRKALSFLIRWKNKNSHKPLIIRGARQVGKTWLMKAFGKEFYSQCAYINFDGNKAMQSLFADNFDISRIILGLEIETNLKIQPHSTLILFDEIQECPQALKSLKYFQENAPEYDIIAAGSLLGVSLHSGVSFPVGKVEFLDLYPLDFEEFLDAQGESRLLEAILQLNFPLMRAFNTTYIDLLRQYFFIGGMPEAVQEFANNRDFTAVRSIQKNILNAYQQDFSKHIPTEIVTRSRMLWNAIPGQLAKENRKFVFGAMKKGARWAEYETALNWLSDCGLIYQINRISKPDLPLCAYERRNEFKLFLLDVGLLGALSNLSVKTLLEGNSVYEEFKGALTEQYVLEQLKVIPDLPICYWSNDTSSAELDFIVQNEQNIVPVEVKASINLRAKSMQSYCNHFSPVQCVRTSLADYKLSGALHDIPLYAIGQLKNILNKE